MFLNILSKIIYSINKNKQLTKLSLLCLATACLIPRTSSYRIATKESLFDQLDFNQDESHRSTNKEAWLSDTRIDGGDYPPHKTIFIHLTGSGQFSETLEEHVSRIVVKSKSVKISESDSSDGFFVKIRLKESMHSRLIIHPLRNHQPNSDLIGIASKFFQPFLCILPADLFFAKPENLLEISLKKDDKSIRDFLRLIRCLINLESYSHGTYYYIPLKNSIIKAEAFFGFIGCVLGHELLDFDRKRCYLPILAILIAFYFTPFAALFGTKKEWRSIFSILACIINFKFGVVYCLFCYSIGIIQAFQLYVRRNKALAK